MRRKGSGRNEKADAKKRDAGCLIIKDNAAGGPEFDVFDVIPGDPENYI
jgi:hypothetical protein